MSTTADTGRGRTTALGETRNEAARRYAQRVIDEDFGGAVSKAARAFGLSRGALVQFLAGKRGAGLDLVDAIAAHRGVSVRVVIDRADHVPNTGDHEGSDSAGLPGKPTSAETATGSASVVMALYFGDQPIRVRDEMTSLTDMWKAAGSDASKRPHEWLRSAQTVEFREFLEDDAITGNSRISLVDTERGVTGGTWAHWQLAMAYARCLSPKFHTWCNQIVRAHFSGETAPVSAFGPQSRAFAQAVAAISVATWKEIATALKANIDATIDARVRTEPRCTTLYTIGDQAPPSRSTPNLRHSSAELKAPQLLNAWRNGLGLTRTAAAEAIGVGRTNYLNWETGRATPRLRHAVRIEWATSGRVPIGSWCPNSADGDAR